MGRIIVEDGLLRRGFIQVPDFVLGVAAARAGWDRAKYVWWGYAWYQLVEGTLTTEHVDWRATLVLYENLRALGHALRLHNWDEQQIQALFWDSAMNLIHGTQAG